MLYWSVRSKRQSIHNGPLRNNECLSFSIQCRGENEGIDRITIKKMRLFLKVILQLVSMTNILQNIFVSKDQGSQGGILASDWDWLIYYERNIPVITRNLILLKMYSHIWTHLAHCNNDTFFREKSISVEPHLFSSTTMQLGLMSITKPARCLLNRLKAHCEEAPV